MTTTLTVPETNVDLVSPEAVRDPHAVFAELRAGGPVWWLERHKAWLVLGHDLVREAVVDERLSTDTITPLQRHLSAEDRARFAPAADLLAGWMIFNDPPVHTALRAPVRKAFTPKAVASLEDAVADVTDRLLDHVDPAGFDVVDALAYPLPAVVIALLLGVPVDRHDEFKGWSRALGALVMGKVTRADAWDRALVAARDFEGLFSDMITRARAKPGDDLVSALVSAADAGGTLTDHQIVGACSLLLFGGHETTTSLITTGVLHMLGAPERQRALGDNPAPATEELLRYDGPSKIVVRRVRADGDWHGYPFRAGQPVFCGLMAANRDPDAFDRPDELVLDRDPNRHLGFGWGLHFCLGAQLARLEAQVVLPRVVARFPDLELAVAPEELAYQPTVVGRTLRSLPARTSR
ncbi:MAG: cytochrome P450 [Acidimicrobiia bacterium]